MDSSGDLSRYHYEGGIGVGTLDRHPLGVNLKLQVQDAREARVGWLGRRAEMAPSCHPERSEGSRSVGVEMLRCAQHDNVPMHDNGSA